MAESQACIVHFSAFSQDFLQEISDKQLATIKKYTTQWLETNHEPYKCIAVACDKVLKEYDSANNNDVVVGATTTQEEEVVVLTSDSSTPRATRGLSRLKCHLQCYKAFTHSLVLSRALKRSYQVCRIIIIIIIILLLYI